MNNMASWERKEESKMKKRIIYFLLVVSLPALMLMSNAMAASGPPIAWAAQATLSTADSNPSQDPEIAGYGSLQVAVWEEWNGGDWDIYMKYSFLDGAPGSWIFPTAPATHPAITPDVDERHPAVAVTRDHPDPAVNQEIHVVYEKWDSFWGNWQVWHTWTIDFGVTWFPMRRSIVGADAIQPACVYTEDLACPAQYPTFGVQMVWAEKSAVTSDYNIIYDSHYYYQGPGGAGVRGYTSWTTIRINPWGVGYNCKNPEIASVDETVNGLTHDYPFAIVWEEEMPSGQTNPPSKWDIWYADGYTFPAIVPPPPPTFPGGYAIINGPNPAFQADALEPDIAATQDYQAVPFELYFFHITFEYRTWAGYPVPPSTPNSIESYYLPSTLPVNGGAAFAIWYAQVRGPTTVPLERPTVASKLISINPTTFESWFAWEDSNTPATAPDIWYRMGSCTPMLFFAWTGGLAAPAGYIPSVPASVEHNPELWNRNDASRMFPPLTHFVFDMDPNPNTVEVEYIDP
jgi:hypothetical protein